MKKNVLASSVAAALVGLGMAGAAHAEIALVVPYYTAQTEHATLLNIVNTDVDNGKAVKVRFRGAANSDDVFDFQVFLSPGDVWTGMVSKGATGAAQLTTTDASCTKPAKSVINATPFITSRLNPALTAEQKAEQTREGYIEIFTMANIPKARFVELTPVAPGVATEQPDVDTAGAAASVNDLYTAIKHVNKVAPCSGTAWTALDTADAGAAITTSNAASLYKANLLGLGLPTDGLLANATIINVARAGAWDSEAIPVSVGSTGGVPYWPQTAATVTGASNYSADPLFSDATIRGTGGTTDTSAAIKAGSYDLPDMSTPYSNGVSPVDKAAAVSASLATRSVTNEFLANADIQSTTDWVFSMPTRRYWVAMDYAAANAATTASPDDGRRFTAVNVDDVLTVTNSYFTPASTTVSGGLICVRDVTRDTWDQEESRIENPTEVVVSPSTLPPATLFCGEASVLSINGGNVKPTPTLNASVAVTDIDVGYSAGWMKLGTAGPGGVGLPVVGLSFTRAAAGDSFFAASWAHRLDRVN